MSVINREGNGYHVKKLRGELHREFLAKVKPDLVAARDEVYTKLRRETVQQEIQQQQRRSIRRC